MTPHLRVVGQNSSLDPASIEELATAMAEQTWVDMRVVPGGIAERVRVVGILIRRDEEEVEIEQWVQDEVGEIEVRKHWVHAEEIWWLKPTAFQAHDELTPFQPKGKRQSTDNAFQAALLGVAAYHRVTADEVAAVAKARLDENHYRYWIMLVYADLVPEAKVDDITALFGYGSPQPMHSARHHMRKHNGESKRDAMLKQARLAMA